MTRLMLETGILDWMIGMTYSSSAPSVTRMQFVTLVSSITFSSEVAIRRSPSIMCRWFPATTAIAVIFTFCGQFIVDLDR